MEQREILTLAVFFIILTGLQITLSGILKEIKKTNQTLSHIVNVKLKKEN